MTGPQVPLWAPRWVECRNGAEMVLAGFDRMRSPFEESSDFEIGLLMWECENWKGNGPADRKEFQICFRSHL